MKTKVKYLNIFIAITIIVLFNSCTKKEPPTGDHTFSCYINGELFVPKGNGNLSSTSPVDDGLSFIKYETYIQVKATDYKKYNVMFNIVNWNEGSFSLSASDGSYYNHTINHAMVGIRKTGKWYLSKDNSGTVTFTKADLNGDTKGTFEFTLYNENDPTDIIHVTNGKFDD